MMTPGIPALGIDVGGGSAKIGIVTASGEVIAENVVASDPTVAASVLLDRYLDSARHLQRALGVKDLCGIGIGLPGHIDFTNGTTRLCNVAALDGFPIVEYVSRKCGTKTLIENDATLAALAEYRFGSGQGSDRFLTVALGTGVGVGFIEHGRPVHTSNGTMGDIGHVIVDPTGARSCRQGCRGCLESVASALALQERFADTRGKSSDAAGLAAMFAAARAGDAACIALIEEAAQNIGAAVVSWMHIFAPDRIAFAGGVSSAGEDLLVPIRKTVNHLAMTDYASRTSILLATLGSKAGVVGAAALCFPNHHPGRAHT